MCKVNCSSDNVQVRNESLINGHQNIGAGEIGNLPSSISKQGGSVEGAYLVPSAPASSFSGTITTCFEEKRVSPPKAEPRQSKPSLDTLDTTSEFDSTLVATGYNKAQAIKTARSKFVGQRMAVQILAHVPDSPLKDGYWDMYHCAGSKILNEDGQYVSKYCRRKYCPTCSRIRTAELINKYLPLLITWPDAQFVTLTAPTVKAEDLPNEIERRLKTFQKIKDSARKDGIKLRGTRNLEIAYNPITDRYHPHYHLIIETEEQAEYLRSGWLQRLSDTDAKAQDVRPFGSDPKSCLEAFKYSNKVSSQVKERHGNKVILRRKIHFEQADIINRALFGKRTFQTFGFTVKDIPRCPLYPLLLHSKSINKENIDTLLQDLLAEADKQHEREDLEQVPNDVAYLWQDHDWFSVQDGSQFSGYEPTDGLKDLMKGKPIDEDQLYSDWKRAVSASKKANILHEKASYFLYPHPPDVTA